MQKLKMLIPKEKLLKMVKKLAQEITKDYKGKELIMVGVLKGGFIFLADLVRELDFDVLVDFISVSSYGNATKSSGVVRIIKDIDRDITGKHVLIVEDLIDTGLTLRYLKDIFKDKGCESVKICAMLDKPKKRKVDINVDYVGIEIPDKFVVGYGLDCAEKYRTLPDVYTLEELNE